MFGAPIVRTTPVQAELAKIWTNILRYATFALPNLLMMDCERYGANVFEVIDLINRDYPRGGIAMPGMTGGTCLRKDFAFSEERSNAPGMLLAVSRVNEAVPLFLVEGIKRRLGTLASRKVAVLGLTFKRNTDDERDSLSHKLIRLLERELADVAVCDPHAPTPTQPLAEAVQDADVVIVATNHSEFEGPERLAEIRAKAAADCLLVDPWNALGTSQVFVYAAESEALLGTSGERPRSQMSRVLVTGGAGTIGRAVVRRLLRDQRWEVRVSDHRPAPDWMREGCEIQLGDLRDHDLGAQAVDGCSHVIHLAAIVGGIANFHKLPFTLTEVNNALTGSLVSASAAHARRALRLRFLVDGLRAGDGVSDHRGAPARVPGAALGVRLLEARRRGVHARGPRPARPALHDLPSVQRLRPGRAARPRRAGNRARRPRPDRQGRWPTSGRSRSSARARRPAR